MANRLDRRWRRNNPLQARWTYTEGAPRSMAKHPPFDWRARMQVVRHGGIPVNKFVSK